MDGTFLVRAYFIYSAWRGKQTIYSSELCILRGGSTRTRRTVWHHVGWLSMSSTDPPVLLSKQAYSPNEDILTTKMIIIIIYHYPLRDAIFSLW